MQIKRGTTVIADVHLMDSSYITEEIMGEHTLILNFKTLEPIELEINDYVLFQGIEYRIRHNERIQKVMKDLGWEYSVRFYAEQYDLQDVLFFLNGQPERRKNADSFNGTARQMLDLIVKNMNRVFSGWQAGDCLETHTETFTFKDKKCSAVLDDLVKTFETEYWIAGKTIHIGKREYDSNGLYLGQGEGMGFRDLDLTAVDEKPPVTALYPYGSDKNLTTDYGADYLLMPNGKLSLEKNIDKYGRFEEAVSFDHIFPTKEFTVTAKIDDCTLQSTDIDFNLTDCLIDETDVIVTFQDGGLAGYDLAIEKESWDNATRQFTLIQNSEENALTVPGDIQFNVGDRFILTGIKMPQKYIEEAEVKLEEEAQKYLDEHCEKRVQLSGKCDDILFRKKRYYIRCGQMIHIISDKLDIDREIRVTKVKRYLENNEEQPYRYELTLSDFLQSNGFKDIIDDVKKMPDEIVNKNKETLSFSKRRWQDAKETQNALETLMKDAIEGFTKGISPISIQTMSMLVGAEHLQFRFIKGFNNLETTDPGFTFNEGSQIFKANAGFLQHMTLDIKDLSMSHNENEYKYWELKSYELQISEAVPYYLYAVCSKGMTEGPNGKKTGTGRYELTPTAKEMDQGDSYYFLVGILSSPFDGKERSFVTLYGYTEILPGQMNVERIISPDGFQYWDMREQSFRIGNESNYFAYNTDGTKRLLLKGVMTQSQGEDEANYLPTYKGQWESNRIYYPADEVTHNGCIYWCKEENTNRNPQTNPNQWQLMINKGQDGEEGTSVITLYTTTAEGDPTPDMPTFKVAPTSTSRDDNSVWWYNVIPRLDLEFGAVIYMTMGLHDAQRNMIPRQSSLWTLPVRLNGKEGPPGTDGEDGLPAPLPTVKEWKKNETYYRNENIIDYIYYEQGDSWWRLKKDFTEQQADSIPDSYYFEQITSYEAIATKVLLADQANLAKFIFSNGELCSQDKDLYGRPNLVLNGKTGKIIAKNAEIEGKLTAGQVGGFKIKDNILIFDGTTENGDKTYMAVGSDTLPGTLGGSTTCAMQINHSKSSNNYYEDEAVALSLTASGASRNYGLVTKGGIKMTGGKAFAQHVFKNNTGSKGSISDAIESLGTLSYSYNYNKDIKYICDLPDTWQLGRYFGTFPNGQSCADSSFIEIIVLVSYYATELTVQAGVDDYYTVQSIYHNGSRIKSYKELTRDNIAIPPGRFARFLFHNRTWYVSLH